jgi:hypothetical protein
VTWPITDEQKQLQLKRRIQENKQIGVKGQKTEESGDVWRVRTSENKCEHREEQPVYWYISQLTYKQHS